MAIKDDYIKIRVSKEQKALFKDIAKKKNISMSKFIIVSTEERALREKEKFEGTKSLELRVSELEKKLQEIKLKMESQKAEKKSFLKFLKSRCLQIEIKNTLYILGRLFLWSSSSNFFMKNSLRLKKCVIKLRK